MKILLLQAFGSPYGTFYDKWIEKIWLLWPSCTLEHLAAVTPTNHEVTLVRSVNERIWKKMSIDSYDLIGISYFTATSSLAYDIADHVREKGIPVILGGYHASALPLEAKRHADAVVIGEAEHTWPRLLQDMEKKALRPFYHQRKPLPADTLPCPTGTNRSYSPIGGIEATRGCVNHCEFCAISHSPMGQRLRLKPIPQVVEAVKSMPQQYFVFMDSSLSLAPGYAKKLFRELGECNKKFACFFNADVARDTELLDMASKAGCIACAIGLETVSQTAIDFLEKQSNIVSDYGTLVKRLHDYGIAVMSSLAFGFDQDTSDIFAITLEKLNEWDVDSTGANILTPLPGTALFTRLRQEERILTYDWDEYDLYHVVFEPMKMTADELYHGTRWFARQFFSTPSSIAKVFSTLRLGFDSFLAILEHHVTSRLIYRHTFSPR
ncbi:MAG: cobalamin-dependent protein [Candidatus Thermoplasmatota archaeon]|nr:cobalamin-dependent protein [Candidatus Thermoplasmatota archaeon]